jgi:hypothetical protein
MKLNRRNIEIPAGTVTQYMTDSGRIVAEFHTHTAHAIFCAGITTQKNLTIYDVDQKIVVYGMLSEVL